MCTDINCVWCITVLAVAGLRRDENVNGQKEEKGEKKWQIEEVRGVTGSTPHWIFKKFLHCVFAKHTLQALLLNSLNPKFCTGKRLKMHTNFTFCFSFWGTSSPDPYRGFTPAWTPLGDFCPPDPWPGPYHVNPLHCKILGRPTPMRGF